MMDIKFEKVSTERQIKSVVKLADEIWKSHYAPIIGAKQVKYMLDNFQSQKAVARQIKDGMSYFLMKSPEKKDIGYIAVKPETDRMYVSKFYVCAPERGRGAGKAAVRYMEELTAAAGKNKMALNVNKNNVNSIEAYKKFGFRTAKSEVNDIGNGFVMDDYVMEKEVNGQRSRF